MRAHLPKICMILFVLSGVALLLYPSVSDYLFRENATKVIDEYTEAVEEFSEEELAGFWEEARVYNESLSGQNITDPFDPGSGMVLPENYRSVLNIRDNGVMASVEIPKIEVDLPVFHGTAADILEIGVGHLENTALPIGGVGNHSVLTGHTGLQSAKIFTDLTMLREGDVFYLHVLDDTLAYRVDNILVIEPSETDALLPVPGRDYTTLVTCTPYAVNSHRLLVRGERIPYEEAKEIESGQAPVPVLDPGVTAVLVFLATLALALLIQRMRRRMKRKREERAARRVAAETSRMQARSQQVTEIPTQARTEATGLPKRRGRR